MSQVKITYMLRVCYIEKCQMTTKNICFHYKPMWNAAYHDCLDQFGLVTLERRRLDLSLCLLYKYVNSMCYFPEGLISKRCNSRYNIHVNHPLLLEQPFASTNSHLYSFIPHTFGRALPSSSTLLSSYYLIIIYNLLSLATCYSLIIKTL